MPVFRLNQNQVYKELLFKAIRSSGAGGQHVNKVSSKVELTFDVEASKGLSTIEKQRVIKVLSSKLTKENLLVMQCDASRSQHRNKEIAVRRFFEMLKKALTVVKKRKPTKPSKSAVEKRLKSKKKDSDKKANRKKPDWD